MRGRLRCRFGVGRQSNNRFALRDGDEVLVARGGINKQCALDQFMRVHIHAEILEIVSVNFGWKAIRLARTRHNRGTNPLCVIGQLNRQSLEVLLIALQSGLLEQIPDAFEVLILIFQMLLDFYGPWSGQRLIAEPFLDTSTNEGRGWLIATFCTDVTLQTG
jgi:hypothetical protein